MVVSGHRKMGSCTCWQLTRCCCSCWGTCRFLQWRAFISVQFVMTMGIEVCCSSHSLRYFSALSKGEPLPVKERLEMPLATGKKDAGLTPGLLKVLHKQVWAALYQMHNAIEECWCVGDGCGERLSCIWNILGRHCVLKLVLVFGVLIVVPWFCSKLSSKGMVAIAELREKWKHLGLPELQLEAILELDNFGEEVEWMKFLALGCSVLGEVRSQQEPS